MKIDEYISSLRSKNIIVSVQDGSVKVKAEDGTITTEILQELKSRKKEILNFFKSIKKVKSFESIPVAKEQDYYPLSSAQRRMYFLYELNKESTTYNMPSFYRISRNLDVSKLEKAFKELVSRHQSLCTVFEIVDGLPLQRILDANLFELDYCEGINTYINRYASEFVSPFNLSKEYPIRVSLMDILGEDYLLMIDTHHIVNDGVSSEVLIRDFWMLYHGVDLPELGIQYKDYAVWQRSESHEELVSQHKAYWLNRYSDDLTSLELPTDYSRPSEPSDKGGLYSLDLTKSQSSKLRAFAHSQGVTMYTLFLSIYNVLLSKLSNQEDIVVGTPSAGRHHSDLEGLIGMFVNTLALRNRVDSKITFKDFLTSVQEDTLMAFDHQLYQYDELVDSLDLPRYTGRNPLFDVFFSYSQQLEDLDFSDSEINIISHNIDYNIAKFDLELDITDQGDNFNVVFNYSASLFKEKTIIKFSKYLKKIIAEVLSNHKIKISEIDILTKKEKAQIIHEFNAPQVNYNIKSSVVDLIEKQVSLTPQANALYFKECILGYHELNQKVNQLAHYLIDILDVQKGDQVGLYFGRSPEMIIGFLAVLKSGATYVSLDPENPSSRVNMLIKDSGMKLIMTNLEDQLVNIKSSVEVLDLIGEASFISEMPDTNPLISIKGSDPAYVIFTSGSTGRPKGVVIEHNSLVDYSITFKEYFSLTSSDKIIQQASPAFDTVVEEVFPALLSGASIVIMPEGGRNIKALIEGIKRTNATVLSTVPVVLDALNNYADDLGSLRFIVSGGDVLLPRHINKLISHYEVFNTYGPSESTVCITYHKISSLDNTSSIGKPIANRQVYILNKSKQLCPIGVAGELCVSGKGLAKGYLNDNKLTENKFIENPIIPGSRIYCTGDAARWNSDGTIEFLGRIDNQVKIRGIRIELGEIESQLESIEEVSEALVVSHGSETNKQLVAYLCGDMELNDHDIKSLLSSKLPDYMIPTSYIWMDSFPLNTNGKIDKRALPSFDLMTSEEYVAAETEDQRRLVEIWSEVLGIQEDKISITSDFFKLGGHSLLAITLTNAISQIFNVEITLRDLFKKSTIVELSAYMSDLDRVDFVSISKASKQDYYPLSSAQRRMYFMYEFDKKSTTYNMPGFYRVSRNLDVSKFESTIHQLVSGHQSLRTVFDIVDGVPIQKIFDAAAFNISHDQGYVSDIDGFIKKFVRPFDLSGDFPFRVSLLDVSGEDYLLMMDTHHIINDGVSNEILMRDFWLLYHGELLPELRIQYVDYAVWQQSDAHQELVSQHKKYWLDRYSDNPNTLELPTAYSRPLEVSDKGGVHFLTLSRNQSNQLRSLASSHGITMYSLFLAIYNVLLSKLSNQDDIVVGTPIAGRHHSDLEGIVGMFVNTIALRNRVDSEMTFKDFLASVQEDTLMAFDHQLYPYEELVDTLDFPRDTGRNPLFDVFFSYVQEQLGEADLNDSEFKMTPYKVAYDIAKFDLSLSVLDSEEINLAITYRSDLFDSPIIVRFSDYLHRIIINVLEDDTQLLGDIDILSGEERNRLLVEFNDTAADFDLNETVLDMFIKRSSLTPDSDAIIFGEETLTYNELDIRSDIWAGHLIDSGVVPGAIVGLIMTRSSEMITAILAVMKAGAAYLPINPDQPISRTEHMLVECKVTTIISNTSDELPNISGITLLDDQGLDNEIDVQHELPSVAPSDLAYIIYTSGSTGEPKGVMIHHNGITNLNNFQRNFFSIDARDKVLQFSPYYFDASVEQIWLGLTTGATLVLISKEIILDHTMFTDYLSKNKISYIHSTPSFLENLSIDELPSLRIVISGGEACKPSLANKFVGCCRFINEYGPTEGTVVSMAYEVLKTIPVNKNIPIGKPIANTQAYVLSDNMSLLPQGVAGELYIGGMHLAKGYINKPELTQNRFIENPFGEGLLYKTGDLVRWISDGTLEYLGRNDHQISLRGYRIELGEIESQLESIDEVSQALVVAHGSDNSKQLIAYLCGNGKLDGNEMKSLISSKLPDYMIPSGYIWLDSFPLNANGKVDKRALPNPDFTVGEEYIAPETEDQQQLVEIWSEVLGIQKDKISITSDFFRLGGHSLLAITLTNKISQTFNIEITLRDLFKISTVAELSAHMLDLDRVGFVSIPKAPDQTYYPLSSAQRRMYFLYEFDKESITYNIPNFYRINKNLDVSQFESVIHQLICRHQSLRTVFTVVDGVPVQRVLDVDAFEISYLQGSASDINSYSKEFVRPFDLSTDFPYRVSLVDISGDDYLLMIDMHHIINDGVSNDILIRDFWLLYHEEVLPELYIQYTDYAVWQQSDAHQELVSKHKVYWLDRYSDDLTTLELPTTYSRPLKQSNQGGVHFLTLSRTQSDALRSLASSKGITMYSLFLAIYNVLLSKLSNQDDIVVGTPTAGRHHLDLEGIVGMFVNTLALRNRIDSETTFKDLLSKIHEDTLMAFDHQLYPYDELVDALDVTRGTGRNPLFDVFFSYARQDETSIVSDVSDLNIIGYNVANTIAKFDLSLRVSDAREIGLSLNYRTDLFDNSTIARFSDYLERIIGAILEDNRCIVGDIDILSEEEKHQLLIDFNTTKKEYALDQTVLDMFISRSMTVPNTTALVFGDERVSYRELDVRSNEWAKHLIKSGMVAGDIIGLIMTRSSEMITAILAIMKAGGAYLPINPDQPTSRTTHMLEDCNVSLVLSNVSSICEDISEYTLLDTKELDQSIAFDDGLPYVEPSDLAYVIYTSGSTGKPKGVMISHESVTNLIEHQKEFFEIKSDEEILQFSPYYFDASVEQIWLALSGGSTLVLIEEETLLNTKNFNSYLREKRVTHLHSTPSFLERIDINDLPRLRRVISGGEVCKTSLADKILDDYPFFNKYGPTETTVSSTVQKIESTETLKPKVSIGRPIANTQAYILSNNMSLLPKGVIGELYLGGKGVAIGYLNKPVLTAERFVKNPFGEDRLYKTGDLVRWLPDGTLEYIGRNDHQVKIRGYRIELGEIESQLEDLNSVRQAIVVAHGSENNKQLIAYICGEEELGGNDIKSLLSSKLLDYMIPTVYIWMDTFPLNANGKVDKKALPSPDFTAGEKYVAPMNADQKGLVKIWSEVLDIQEDKISIISDFFKLGGHSLTAMTLRHQIKRYFNIELSLSDIFLNPTICSLSERIQECKTKDKKDLIVIPINNASAKENLFIIHDGSGEIDGYLELSTKIHEYTCYGIKFGQFNILAEVPTIQEIASKYIDEIKAIQSVGPYHFLGWSLGGVIAAEMTSQLESAGEKVENLVIIDSALKYEKTIKNVQLDIESEIELLKSTFGFSNDDQQFPSSFQEVWLQFLTSEVFENLSIDKVRSTLPENIKQLIPDFSNRNKEELFTAVNKIRILVASSAKYLMHHIIKANTLYIKASQSDAIQNEEIIKPFFLNFHFQYITGDHFSIMKNPTAIDVSNIIQDHLDLNLREYGLEEVQGQ